LRVDWTISTVVHVVLITLGLVTFTWTRPRSADTPDFIAVNVVSDTNVSSVTAGVKNAPKATEEAKPLADKTGDPKPVKQLAPKVADKPEITTDAPAKPEPKPVEKTEKPKQAESKPDQPAEQPKKEEAKKPPKPKWAEFKPDQIAEQLKKDKDEPKKPSPKFDANQVAVLLDKRDPQRQVATAATLNGNVALGAPTGHAAQLSQSELDALRAKLISVWNPPPAVSANPDQYVITLHLRLARDHRLIGQPEVLTRGDGPLFEATRDSAVRAVLQAQPYDMLSQTTYDLWKELDINFNPREVFGG
jgi:outer membrane biosynthesis protein TonB